MAIEALVIDPAIPALPEWGWPQPIWLVLTILFLAILHWIWKKNLKVKAYREPWRALAAQLASASNQRDDQVALAIAIKIKSTLLFYLPRQQVAAWRIEQSVAWLGSTITAEAGDVEVITRWLVSTCYGQAPLNKDSQLTAKALSKALLNLSLLLANTDPVPTLMQVSHD